MADFDLNLVRTFVLLYETRSVSRTAEELHLSQPTVSYGLGKLRRRFNDDLFQRSNQGLNPTAIAHRMYEPLRRAMAEIDGAVSVHEEFDPATMAARFTLALSDLGEISLLPRLLAEARRRGPRVSFTVRSLDVDDAQRQLGRGEIDAFVATPIINGPQVARIPLFRERYVVVAWQGHPRLQGDSTTVEQLAAEKLAVVFGPSGHLNPRAALDEHDLLDNVVLEVTRFATLPYVLEDSDLVTIVPEYVAEQFIRSHPVQRLSLPFELPPIEVAAYARHHSSRSPAQLWLVDFLVEVLGEQVSAAQLPPQGRARGPRGRGSGE